ncbi:MAG: hypothetical protein R3E01_17475 [Pirellulaceae bacterium]
MPAVSGGDQHGVDIGAGEEFAEVAIGLAVLVAVVLVDELFSGIAA